MRLLISTGEVSGDLQGSFLVKALKKEAASRSMPLELIALGGPRMKSAGAELLVNTASIGAIGFWEALPFVMPTLRAQAIVNELLVEQPPDGLVLIDYMGPNIRLGNKVKKVLPDVPITYYIAPQEWAWRLGDGGTTDLISFTDKILAIFKEEAEFYSSRGGNVTWVGHPMLDNLKKLPDRDEACQKLGIEPSQKILLLLPASRSQELKYVLPILLKAAYLLQQYDPSIYVIAPSGMESFEKSIEDSLHNFGVNGKVIPANKADDLKSCLFAAADIALAKSGTINMELALHNVPQIVGYRVSKITAFIAKNLLKFNVDHISPVNLLLKERLVPELVQDMFNPKAIFELAVPLLEDQQSRIDMIRGYKRLRESLGSPDVTQRAAKEILDLLT
ncbi:lipid-A-disaccharide synthase [Prochlorococcus marinus]|uniref:Lipid-A-disaccharide synthase n=1 Tax=Prochlorococcus marinus (strain MIT 9211) TaxID=93059 RepID=A9BBV7_PROM4|nr:lipid-A-disaccharide synthase [Prochlorococcus marinus]ABX09319.1 Lipid-A-disaccharide synthetase [Prochlorococcus marinus str. MIT 9211]